VTAFHQAREIQKDEAGLQLAYAANSAVYVDELFVFKSRDSQAQRAGQTNDHLWCHMWSVDVDALHIMAKNIGMQREWFQDRPGFPHYDLPPARRDAALALGAIEYSLRKWLRARRTRKIPQSAG
jgi:hypothetical protein